jgi:microcystin-dependent protein
MSCENCLQNCGDSLTTDKCVKYTGPDVPILGICTGDSLFQVEEILIDALIGVTSGTSITLSDLTLDCALITTLLDGKDKTVANLVQVLVTASCQTKGELDALYAQVNAPFSISGACLTLPTNPTRDQVLQAIATKLCSTSDAVNAIAADYVKASQLCSLVNSCISGGATGQEYLKMPKYVALPYHGPLTVFDAGGAGIAAQGYDKVYICAGQSVGTFTLPDYRGRSPIGANTNVPGGAMDSDVDPSLAANAGYSIVAGTKKGEYAHTLVVAENAAHTHSVNDPGHTHSYIKGNVSSHPTGNATNAIRDQVSDTTTSSTTGITINSSGGSQPHNTVHPSIGTTFIMHVP